MGTGARLRETFPDVVVAAAEPLPGDPVMGLRSLEDGYVPPILDVSKLDRKMLVSNQESIVAVHELLDREGIFAGVSAGAVVHVARKLALSSTEGVVVCVLADAGWKYLGADSGRPTTSSDVDGAHALVVVPASAPGARRAHARGGTERGLRADRRCATASPSGTSAGGTRPRRRTASSSTSTPSSGSSRTRASSSPSSTRTSGAAAPVAHRRREHRSLAGEALPDLLAARGRACRVVDRRRRDPRARRGVASNPCNQVATPLQPGCGLGGVRS